MKFKEKYNLSDSDLTYLWNVFMDYGMTRSNQREQSKANHYFLQGICEHSILDWKNWNKKLTPTVRKIITEKYPQLMVNDKSFEGQSRH